MHLQALLDVAFNRGTETSQRRKPEYSPQRCWLAAILSLTAACSVASNGYAQQTWQPARIPASSAVQHVPNQPGLNSRAATRSISAPVADEVPLGDSQVVLRWKPASRGSSSPGTPPSATDSNPANSGGKSRLTAREVFATQDQNANRQETSRQEGSRQVSNGQRSQVWNPQLFAADGPSEAKRSEPVAQRARTSAAAPTRQSAMPQPDHSNPLRNAGHRASYGGVGGQVRTANYQAIPDPFEEVIAEELEAASPPSLQPGQVLPLPSEPFSSNNRELPNNFIQQDVPGSNLPTYPPADPLQSAEQAPGPGNAQPGSLDQPSILQDPPISPFRGSEPSASDAPELPNRNQLGQGLEVNPQDRPEFEPTTPQNNPFRDNQLEMPERGERDKALSCEDRRNLLMDQPISRVDLDVSPNFGEGMRGVRKENEDKRLEFAANAKVRQWRNNEGELLAKGRLINMRHDSVVLDVDGAERTISLRDLSDVDSNYVGDAWGIPLTCGRGSYSYAGRNHIESAVQWKAPGHCHKPLYFEQQQLERYGHELGPVLQPLVSTAHFFGNIAVLPYKMGIHPPGECQYPLGYYRPGDCAPYMIRPIPWSLRGAAVQAGVVGGAIALIP